MLSILFGLGAALGWVFLKERLSLNQWIGIIAALIAIVLLTI